MTDEELRAERLYQQTMTVFQKMLKDALISQTEYDEIDERMCEKYKPKFGTILSRINLLL